MTSTARRFATATAVAALTLPATAGLAQAEPATVSPALGSIPGEFTGSLVPFGLAAQSLQDPLYAAVGSVFGAYCAVATQTNHAACA